VVVWWAPGAPVVVTWRLGEVQPGRSGYPNQSGRVIRVIESSGNTIFNPKSDPKLHYPQPRVPTDSGSGSGLPVLPEKIK
jgi:hypothetical protein